MLELWTGSGASIFLAPPAPPNTPYPTRERARARVVAPISVGDRKRRPGDRRREAASCRSARTLRVVSAI